MNKIPCNYEYDLLDNEHFCLVDIYKDDIEHILVEILKLNDYRIKKMCFYDVVKKKEVIIKKNDTRYIIETKDVQLCLEKIDAEFLFSFLIESTDANVNYNHVDLETNTIDMEMVNLCVRIITNNKNTKVLI